MTNDANNTDESSIKTDSGRDPIQAYQKGEARRKLTNAIILIVFGVVAFLFASVILLVRFYGGDNVLTWLFAYLLIFTMTMGTVSLASGVYLFLQRNNPRA